MRIEDIYGKTLRDVPTDAEMVNHQYAIRAGLVRPLTAGIYAWLPVGLRVLRRVEDLLRHEMIGVGCQEVQLPVVHPAEIWQKTGRYDTFGPVLLRFANRDGRQLVLGPTHEEIVAALTMHEVESYRDLPSAVFQIQTKYRDEARPRGGLVRLREFIMKDAYSLDRDLGGLDDFYDKMYAAYLRIFDRLGIDVVPLEADVGAMGGFGGHEFAMRHEQGEDRFVQCDSCGYAANVEAARFDLANAETQSLEPLQKVATPACKTIDDVAAFIGVPTAQTLKAVFFMHNEETFIFVVVRGDLEVNEAKLVGVLGGGVLRAATEEEIQATGAEPGYASPLGLVIKQGEGDGVVVVADRSIEYGANFVVGANDEGYHYTGANYARDFVVTQIADIAEAYEGARCSECHEGHLHIERAIELGHCFKLGTYYSEKLNVNFSDENGDLQPVVMGSYGIGLDRLIAATIETHHDEYGIIWPRNIAPFDVHIVTLGKDDVYQQKGVELTNDLQAAGLSVLLDDRQERPGVKFADADLIGVPLRLTVSKRALERGAIEAKWRHDTERFDIDLDSAVDAILSLLV